MEGKWLVRISVMLLAVELSGVGRSWLVGFDPVVKLGRSVRNNLRDIVHHFSKFVKSYHNKCNKLIHIYH